MSERDPGIGGDEHLESKPVRVLKTGGSITIYRPMIKVGKISVLGVPSKPGRLLFLGKSIPCTEGLAGSINQITNRLRLRKKQSNYVPPPKGR